MMTSIFAQTIVKAISTYRQMLRRYLSQADRVSRLSKLNLKDASIYESEVALYHTAHAIVKDIEENMDIPEQGYYSYSGIGAFCEYLKEYLSKYSIENGHVVHQAQKASKALIQAIQLIGLPESRVDENVKHKLACCNEVIATCGSEEQHEMHITNLERIRQSNEALYTNVLQNFKEKLAGQSKMVGQAE